MSFVLRPVSSVSRICSAASHFRASPSQSRFIHTSRTGVNVSRFAAVPISGPALGVASQPWLRLRGMSVASGSHTSSTVGLKEAQQSQTVDSGVGAPGYKLPSQVEGTIAVKIDGKYSSHPALEQHEKIVNSEDPTANNYLLPHPLWNGEYVLNVHYTHLPPKDNVDKLAMYTIKAIRFNFDWMSGYTFGRLTETKALTRIMFLETVAGVPGSIGGTLRHLASLRRMKRDGGWIRTLLDEAENERMHLLTALALRKPGAFMRALVLLTQGVFYNFFWISYMISPRFCHRLVGYLEEEAVATYTKILNQIDAPNGSLTAWKTLPAPEIAKKYWSLPDNATFRDVLAYIRADEAHHRDVNHKLASIPKDALNPFRAEH